MATRVERCKWCNNQLLVPLNAQTISCPVCRRISHLAPARNNGYYQQPSPPMRYNQQPSRPPAYNHQQSMRPLMNNNSGNYNQHVLTPPVNNNLGSYNHQGSTPPVNNNGYYNQQALTPPMNNNYGGYNQQLQTGPMNNNNGGYNQQVPTPSMNNNNGNYNQQVPTTPMNNNNGNYNQQVPTPPMNNNGSYNQQVPTPPMNNNSGSYNQQVPTPPMNNNNGNYNQQVPTPPMNNNNGSYNQQVSPAPAPVFGRKRAVLCGISYRNTEHSLDGSVTDVESIKRLLIDRMGFPDSSVVVLTEDEPHPLRIPTAKNIMTALHWLVKGCKVGDSLVFYYTGHSSRVPDDDDDEFDGYDEALCPVDYKTAGKILDDKINETIVRPLPRGVQLHAIIDTCYSGTALDLCFICRMNSKGKHYWEDHENPDGKYQGTNGGLAISISACDDHQKSGNTTAFTGKATGALTYSFVKAVQSEPTLTYGRLMSSMCNEISKAQSGLGLNASSSTQEPQLSSSEKFVIHSKKFVL